MEIRVRNVQQALPEGVRLMKCRALTESSRNGPVYVAHEPVLTDYLRPNERVIFWPERDANPFFHLFEGLWMLAGRDDIKPLEFYVSRMREYSDDGVSFHGAYGYRWRSHFGLDQLYWLKERLTEHPDDRRAVLGVWDPTSDLVSPKTSMKDLPCNTHAYFTRGGPNKARLDMTVCSRSNDMVWGAYGANAVHWSMLLEFLAAWIGVDVGHYRQFSNNFHAYTGPVWDKVESLDAESPAEMYHHPADPYANGEVAPLALVEDPERFSVEVGLFTSAVRNAISDGMGAAMVRMSNFEEPFLRHVAVPMHNAYALWRVKLGSEAAAMVREIPGGNDWRRAGLEWLARRAEAKQ